MVELISADEEDLDDQRQRIFPKILKEMSFMDGTELQIFDDLTNFQFKIVVRHKSSTTDNPLAFLIGGTVEEAVIMAAKEMSTAAIIPQPVFQAEANINTTIMLEDVDNFGIMVTAG